MTGCHCEPEQQTECTVIMLP